jgi:tetratricopeptide (TPR) repeat protein
MRVSLSLLLVAAMAFADDDIAEGRALLGGPDHAKGVTLIRRGIAKLEKEPATGATRHRIGLGHFYLQEDAKAQAAFREAAALEPKNAEHPFMLAVLLMYGGDLPGATHTMEKAIRLAPKEARYRFEFGRILALQKRHAEALEAYRMACELDPRHAEAQMKVGDYLAAKQPKQALVHYARAVAAEPRLVNAWYNAAQVHYNLGQFEEAREKWTRAAALAPDDFEIQKKLVQACYALGKHAEAAPHRERVLALRAADPKLKDLKEFCFDQFEVDGNRVLAYETFDKRGDLYYHFTFKVVTPQGKISKTINLESSAVIRESGTPYVLGANLENGVHRNYGIYWKKLPAYPELKKLVIRAAKGELDES